MTTVSHGIPASEHDLTDIVIRAMGQSADARSREVLASLVRHAHAFIRETRLTEAEFERGLEFVKGIGQECSATKNEVVLAADVLGFSTLVALINNPTRPGQTAAALLGPFYRANAPECELGECIARSTT